MAPIPQDSLAATMAPPSLWDPVIRITHWGVALAVLLNSLFTEDGSANHIWIGWTLMALLLLRLVWGFAGPAEARFSAFPPNPRAALSHLADLLAGRPKPHRSHNPAGAIMVWSLWATLAVIIATGLMMNGVSPLTVAREQAAVAAGDWSVLVEDAREEDDDDDKAGGKIVEEVHEVAANLILFLAFLHIAGVFVESRAMRRNLVAPMLTGLPNRGRRRK